MRSGIALALAAALGLGLAACGDNDGGPGADGNPGDDAPEPDGPLPADDFTAFVKDQVVNHTTDTEDPVPFAMFEALTDNDLDDDAFAAYASLF